MIKVALMASGQGSNARKLWEMAQHHPEVLKVVVLICDQAEAPVLAWAKTVGLAAYCLPRNQVKRSEHEAMILTQLKNYQVDWVCLAGYMRILSKNFLANFYDPELKAARILNIHPSLLPSFPGANGYSDAYQAGVKLLGVTVHLVDAGMDTGPILAQAGFKREMNDSLEQIKAKGLKLEHELYPQVLLKVAQGKLKVREHFYAIDMT